MLKSGARQISIKVGYKTNSELKVGRRTEEIA